MADFECTVTTRNITVSVPATTKLEVTFSRNAVKQAATQQCSRWYHIITRGRW